MSIQNSDSPLLNTTDKLDDNSDLDSLNESKLDDIELDDTEEIPVDDTEDEYDIDSNSDNELNSDINDEIDSVDINSDLTETDQYNYSLNDIIIIKTDSPTFRITKNIPLTKYELTQIIGIRSKQFDKGAEPLVNSIRDDNMSDKEYYEYMVIKEIKDNKSPIIIRRPLPNNIINEFKINELIILPELLN